MNLRPLSRVAYALVVAVAVPLVVYAAASIPADCATPGDCDSITPRFETLTVKHTMSGQHVYVSGTGSSPLIVTNADGYVGIGLSDPTVGRLEVSDTTNATSDEFRSILTLNDETANPSSIIPGGGAGLRFRGMTQYGRSTFGGIWAESETGNTNGKLQFMTRGGVGDTAPDMTLTSVGNLGLGTTTPTTKLEVVGTMSGQQLYISGTGSSPILYSMNGGTLKMGTEYAGPVKNQLHLAAQTVPTLANYKSYAGALGMEGMVFASYVAKDGPYQRVSDIAALGVPSNPYGAGELRLLTNPVDSATAVARLILRSNGDVGIGGSMTTDNSFAGAIVVILSTGKVGIGTTSPQSPLHVPDGSYFQAEDNNAGAPPVGDCDSDTERGRISYDSSNNRLYFCAGASRGWDYTTLTD